MKDSRYLLWLLIPLMLAGCSHAPKSPSSLPASPAKVADTLVQSPYLTDEDPEESPQAEIDPLHRESERLLDSLAVTIGEPESAPDISDSLAALTEARMPSVDEIFDYPVVVNRRVLAWIDFYLGKGKNSFDRSLQRSGRYIAMARKVFAEEGIPQDLVFLGHVESAFQHKARSRAKALGLWQFMRGTAQLYELRCDGYVDERLDPEKETRAAARYLKDLYAIYGDWYLSLAAYNAGAGKVDRAIKQSGSRDFWQIARSRYLVNETRNFVPAILAATILAKSPGAFGFTEETDPPLCYDTVTVDSPTDLRVVAQCTDVSLGDLQELNPCLLHLQTPPETKKFTVNVPLGGSKGFAEAYAKIPVENRLVFQRHKVRSGETLGGIAKNYRTTVSAIQGANGLGRRTTIYVNQTLKIPAGNSGAIPVGVDRTEAVHHTVRRGESLSKIAEQYGVSIQGIQTVNRISDPSRILPGAVLIIPPSPKARKDPDPSSPSGGKALVADSRHKSLPSIKSTGKEGDEEPVTQHGMPMINTADALGRVPSTIHIVEDAREAIKSEPEEKDPPSTKSRIHVVRRGETLSGIASRYGVTLSSLRSWNDLNRQSKIYPGQRIVLGNPGTTDPSSAGLKWHVVHSGESLWKIAKKYGVRVGDLIAWNSLRQSSVLHPGQKLKIN
ncbi:MAG: LysM peptidoglycan-binding domain-containing protein [Candidatus Eisenbacteria bacterium]|uniref:LysM peptidoglycan-binding domain-containing protein n=1 Tax=Eiseniibacteriota bacterium TaxID=2212470 RepID=A0A948RVN2_UNCEI|nr:LysM peptidoglycan-binding domain-containing protein [Candidatus Eisenbacteria bacterium]MBU1951230.1 LysM peptidoglycan-binding domain-containing protein [Candidatus Eisenbacteria bacterium]MBU2691341.1 LysM peptidoglycan-binding domain-containing protein [Candidatus Eisenbacteria bacterium]